MSEAAPRPTVRPARSDRATCSGFLSLALLRPLLPAALLQVALLPATPLAGQALPMEAPLPLTGVTGYDPAIPTPEEVIGHRVGTRHTEPARIVAYFRAVAEASDRVVLGEHARSHEDRPLIHAVITSPARHARLEEARLANLRLSDEPGSVTDAELDVMPVVATLGYSIHGDEASGSEAAMVVLYHLAAGRGPAVERVLEDAIVLLDPMLNPDGRDRFVDWVNRNRGAVPVADPQDREHDQPWPGGRTNHYWFDLNRDWLPLEHPESRGRVELFHRWRPQLLTDHHEMGSGSTFFFQPGVPSRTHPLTPPRNQELTARMAAFHAARLDAIGQLYFTEEGFDDYYYGKGSTYPDVNGAVGILFEQASSRALVTETDAGPLRYATTVRNQVAASLSTLEGLVELRPELLRHQRSFYASASAFAAASPVKAFVVGTERAPQRARALGELLRRHRIRIHGLARDLTTGGRTFRVGRAWVVPVDQPQARLVRALMERATSFPDSIFYDVSTWTLPLAYDVEHAALSELPDGLLGPELEAAPPVTGEVVGGRAGVAYLLPWDRYLAPRALHRLQRAGLEVRMMTVPFTAIVEGSERRMERGTAIVPLRQDGADAGRVHALVGEAADADGVRFFATNTALTPGGPDLGSREAPVLAPPRVALVTGGSSGRGGGGASAYDAGQAWHLLSERFGVPVSLLEMEDLGRADLSRYDVLLLAGGSYRGFESDALRAWIASGGRLVALSTAVDRVVEEGLVELEPRPLNMDSLLAGVPHGELSRARGSLNLGGTIFRVRLDTTHPLAFGLPESLPVFRGHDSFYDPSGLPGRDVGRYDGTEPVMSGYAATVHRERAAGALAVWAGPLGRGRIVLLMDDPDFRAFWHGSSRLLLNAVFLGGLF